MPQKVVIAAITSGTLLVASLILLILPNRNANISFPEVGQGDCALVELRSGKTILIDGGGTYDNRFDIGRRIIAPYLWNRGIYTIDLVILSHPHPDHMNGLKYVLRKFPVSHIWETGRDPGLPGYEEFLQIITEKNITRSLVSSENMPFRLGEAELSILHPSRKFHSSERQAYAAENDQSLVLRIDLDGIVSIFTGDIGSVVEKHLAATVRDLKCDLLKVPHHGSKTSSSELFVSKTTPRVAVVTVGKGNRYRHPSDEVISRYSEHGAHIYRTDRDGAITVQLQNGRMHATHWNDLTLNQANLDDRTSWGRHELRNWSRFRTRITSLFF